MVESNYANTVFSVVRESLEKLGKQFFFPHKFKESMEKSGKTGKESGKSGKSEGNFLTQMQLFFFSLIGTSESRFHINHVSYKENQVIFTFVCCCS